ncbi:MAG TPA: hypothetical protein VNO35_26575 [Steroidobacteraceae bacterium]|nr:hypothetical protein [Steroidobacteraceae bacterium]
MIQRGISIYSFQEKYYRGEMSLEDCLATASKMGVRGFEMLSDQMIPGYPSIKYNLSDEFLDCSASTSHIWSSTKPCVRAPLPGSSTT